MSAFDSTSCVLRAALRVFRFAFRPFSPLFFPASALGFALFLMLWSCTPPGYGEKEKNSGVVNIDLRDKTVRRMYEFGKTSSSYYLVIELLGKSLESLHEKGMNQKLSM